MLLELDSVNAYYGQSQVLNDVSLGVDSDQITALLGRNGAGKTTTIKTILGLDVRREGSITFDGTQIGEIPPNEIFHHGISWIPQERRIFTNLTTEENLKMGLDNSSDEKINETYDLFPRLSERRTQRAGTLSGGEKQMLTIGRAMVSDPELILIDEPFEGLMPKLIPEITDVFSELREYTSMLLASQNVNVSLGLADKVYVIETGEIVYSGDPEQFKEESDLQEKYIGVGN